MAMAALLFRAKQLHFVNDNQARYLWQQFNIHKSECGSRQSLISRIATTLADAKIDLAAFGAAWVFNDRDGEPSWYV